MIKKILLNQSGISLTMFVMMMPVIIGLMGLCVDGSYYLYERIKLDMATDAAARGAVHSLDLNRWRGQREIVLDHQRAVQIIQELLAKNMPGARYTKVEIPENAKNECIVETEVTVPTFFMKVVGIQQYKVRAKATGKGFDLRNG